MPGYVACCVCEQMIRIVKPDFLGSLLFFMYLDMNGVLFYNQFIIYLDLKGAQLSFIYLALKGNLLRFKIDLALG